VKNALERSHSGELDAAPETERTFPRPVARRIKDIFDRIAAAICLVLVSPLLIAIAAAVRLTSKGPVIYRRRVLGRHGVPFDAFKFRTMVADAEQLLPTNPEVARQFAVNMKLRNDPRLTRFGRVLRRSSLDELPQLLNVLRGEMSLVGPRIIAPEEVPRYGAHIHSRLSVKPGITGLWQVSGRQELGYGERVALDLEYIEHWSLWLDVCILLRTVPAVLSMRGAL
jgi:lipopolysaccharide/colanic/teichoic acid biosynthesis glycosyltransferase